MADGSVVGIPRQSPGTTNQTIQSIEQTIDGNTTMIVQTVASKNLSLPAAAHTRVQPGATSVTLLAANERRFRAMFYNFSNFNVFISAAGVAATANDWPIEPGAWFTDDTQTGQWTVISPDGTADVRVTEWLVPV